MRINGVKEVDKEAWAAFSKPNSAEGEKEMPSIDKIKDKIQRHLDEEREANKRAREKVQASLDAVAQVMEAKQHN